MIRVFSKLMDGRRKRNFIDSVEGNRIYQWGNGEMNFSFTDLYCSIDSKFYSWLHYFYIGCLEEALIQQQPIYSLVLNKGVKVTHIILYTVKVSFFWFTLQNNLYFYKKWQVEKTNQKTKINFFCQCQILLNSVNCLQAILSPKQLKLKCFATNVPLINRKLDSVHSSLSDIFYLANQKQV